MSSGVARTCSNSEISAPATNALSPAPRTTITRTSGSASSSVTISVIACHIAFETALRRSGLLKIIQPIEPCFSSNILSVRLAIGLDPSLGALYGASFLSFAGEVQNQFRSEGQLANIDQAVK